MYLLYMQVFGLRLEGLANGPGLTLARDQVAIDDPVNLLSRRGWVLEHRRGARELIGHLDVVPAVVSRVSLTRATPCSYLGGEGGH